VVQAWTTPIASLALGGEVIRNTRLGLTSGDLGDADMVLGVDFFLAHRIYVSRDQQRIYVTYNGGGVFRPGAEAAPAQVGDTQPDDAAAGADGLRRRGAALLARGQAAQAIEAFGRAIQLQPRAAGAYYDRAMAYSQQGQLDLSLADLDAGLALEPGDAAFLLARAAVYIVRDAQGDPALAKVDLDAAARHAAGHPVLELRLAELYEQADQFGEAVRRYGVWLAANPYDGQRAEALNGRCRALALQRKDLDQALKDCAAATRLRSGDPYFLETRALARLARSEFGPAIADAGAVLTLNPKAALARWVRGRAELGAGRTAEGRADLTAAADADPKAAARLERLGFAS
jgi:tetratricopeptide (TPR) repeat protein